MRLGDGNSFGDDGDDDDGDDDDNDDGDDDDGDNGNDDDDGDDAINVLRRKSQNNTGLHAKAMC